MGGNYYFCSLSPLVVMVFHTMKVLVFVTLRPFLSELGSDQEDESVSNWGPQSHTKNQEVALSQVRFSGHHPALKKLGENFPYSLKPKPNRGRSGLLFPVGKIETQMRRSE